ncbi:unnamed protein product [Colletotrichum noveboracense]|uniref:Uncharacterized protein n=1 Tax=Colletotrichum noveboracense TaxID=2664923 RepID=A0A9W4RXI1_9PEZI|nr:unnamed protein product [Colletotrichum noveboracense]
MNPDLLKAATTTIDHCRLQVRTALRISGQWALILAIGSAAGLGEFLNITGPPCNFFQYLVPASRQSNTPFACQHLSPLLSKRREAIQFRLRTASPAHHNIAHSSSPYKRNKYRESRSTPSKTAPFRIGDTPRALHHPLSVSSGAYTIFRDLRTTSSLNLQHSFSQLETSLCL